MRAIEAAAPGFASTKRRTHLRPVFDDSTPGFSGFPPGAYVDPSVQIAGWHLQLTAALMHDGLGRFDQAVSWPQAVSFAPGFFPSASPDPLPLDSVLRTIYANRVVESGLAEMDWVEGWSASPRPYPQEIYRFSVGFINDKVFFHHRFFDAFDWYVGFRAPRQIARALRRRAMRSRHRTLPAT
jgi:hypothetical protein